MADEEMEEIESSEDNEQSGPGLLFRLRKVFLLLGIIVVQAAAAYAVARFLILPRLPGEAAETTADSLAASAASPAPAGVQERGTIVMMDNVVVNLVDARGTHYLKVAVALEFKEKELEQEINERMPELRDMLINHLASRRMEEVINRDAREIIKRQLLDLFNRRLQAGQLLNVYFSDFVVQ